MVAHDFIDLHHCKVKIGGAAPNSSCVQLQQRYIVATLHLYLSCNS